VAERGIQTLFSAAASVRASLTFELPAAYDGHLLRACADSINSYPNTNTNQASPKVLIEGVRPSLDARLGFGATCLIAKQRTTAVAFKGEKAMLGVCIGPSNGMPAYMFVTESNEIVDREAWTLTRLTTPFGWPAKSAIVSIPSAGGAQLGGLPVRPSRHANRGC
jgi:hypothetical protein